MRTFSRVRIALVLLSWTGTATASPASVDFGTIASNGALTARDSIVSDRQLPRNRIAQRSHRNAKTTIPIESVGRWLARKATDRKDS